jgi:hypothetical protein
VDGACARESTSFLAIRSRTNSFEPRNTAIVAIMSIHTLLYHDKTSTAARTPDASGKNSLFEARLANNLPKTFQSGIETEQM